MDNLVDALLNCEIQLDEIRRLMNKLSDREKEMLEEVFELVDKLYNQLT